MAGASGILAMLGKSKGGGSKGPPSMGESKPESESDETGEALMEMFDALKAGDSSGAALAFKRAYASCEGGGEHMGMGDDESAEGEDDLDL